MTFRSLMYEKRGKYLAGPQGIEEPPKGEVGTFLATFDDLDGLEIGGGKKLSAVYNENEDKYTVTCDDVEATVVFDTAAQKFVVAVDAPSANEGGEAVAENEDDVRGYLANFLGMYLDVQGE